MLTKSDLSAIKAVVSSEIKSEIKVLRTEMNENVEDLVELITAGFGSQEAGFRRIDSILDNHEGRIGILENKTFKTN